MTTYHIERPYSVDYGMVETLWRILNNDSPKGWRKLLGICAKELDLQDVREFNLYYENFNKKYYISNALVVTTHENTKKQDAIFFSNYDSEEDWEKIKSNCDRCFRNQKIKKSTISKIYNVVFVPQSGVSTIKQDDGVKINIIYIGWNKIVESFKELIEKFNAANKSDAFDSIIFSEKTFIETYSPLDIPIVINATKCGFALIGETAVQFLARMYKVKENRERSRDDIDFMSAADNKGIEEFKKYLSGEKFVPFIEENNGFQLGYANKKAGVEVNVLLTYDSEFEGQTEKVDLMTETFGEVSVLFWKPVYLFKAKVQMMSTSDTRRKEDTADLRTLYDIIEKRGEKAELEKELSGMDLPAAMIKLINGTIGDWVV